MLKSLIAFCLSRRAIIVFGLLVFAGRRVLRLQEAQHRGVSESDAGHPGNHRAGAGSLRRGDGALLHASRSRLGSTRRPASRSSAPLRSMACPLSGSCSSMGLTITLPTARRRSRCNKTSAFPGGQVPTNPAEQRDRGNLSLPGGRSEAFRADQSPHRSGLDRARAGC